MKRADAFGARGVSAWREGAALERRDVPAESTERVSTAERHPPPQDRRRSMARSIYGMITSLDGYVADRHGKFGWGAPEDEGVQSSINALALRYAVRDQ
jgi:hypothetical protein